MKVYRDSGGGIVVHLSNHEAVLVALGLYAGAHRAKEAEQHEIAELAWALMTRLNEEVRRTSERQA